LVFYPRHATGQIVLDWATQKLVSYPQIVNNQINTTVVVNNVNDLLYQYKIDVVATPQPSNPPAPTPSAATKALAAEAVTTPGCQSGAAQLTQATYKVSGQIADIIDCTKQKDKKDPTKPGSVSLQDTEDAWNAELKSREFQTMMGDATVPGSVKYVTAQCTLGDPALALAAALQTLVDSFQKKVDGLHQLQQATTLSAGNDYTVTVTEFCHGTQTAKLTQKFSPSSNILTLSLGALLSGIQQRSYSSSKDPSNTQQNLLTVSGTGPLTPLGAGLLNYELKSSNDGNYGLTASSGLVLKFGASQVGASSLGWFGGLSVHLYHRLFITGGLHVGQFTDFPPGLVRGSVVPANYGNLTGVNRSTAKFAFAVTYQTKDFASLTKPSTTTSTKAPTN